MEQQLWQTIDRLTSVRWFFGAPLLTLLGVAVAVALVAAVRLRERSRVGVLLTSCALGGAVALLVPGALLALWPLPTLGLPAPPPPGLTTASFSAAAQRYEHSMQLVYVAGGLLLLGGLSAFGLPGLRQSDPCPTCGRDRHPSWKGVCPECQLLGPEANELPLLSETPGAQTQFGFASQTELLDGAAGEGAWLSVVQGPSAVGERVAVGARLAIGRDPARAQLVLDDEAVSTLHAIVEREGEAYSIRDSDSRNGLLVNGARVARHELRDGDIVELGRTRLRFSAPPPRADSAPTMLLDPLGAGAQLVLLNAGAPAFFPLTQLDTNIGRDRRNDVVLESPSVSRQHASICFDGTDFYLVDAGTPNGTWLDGSRVFDRVPLRPGQEIRVGDRLLRFEREENS